MILELHRQGLSVAAIARRVGVDRKTVRKYIAHGMEPPAYGPRPAKARAIDGFLPYLRERLEAFPTLTASRLRRELRERGFGGSYTVVKRAVRELRPARPRSYEVRFETRPGQQGQADFARFEVSFTEEPDVRRIVWLFSMVLGHSRMLWGRFALRQDLATVLRCHVAAFEAFGGVPQEILYDRMKTAVIGEDAEGLVLYNRGLLDVARHYGFQPRACQPYRAKTKGKVERPFRYIREDFFLGRSFRNLEDLNQQFQQWLETVANLRRHATTGRIVSEAFAEERGELRQLPPHPYRAVLSLERRISHEGMVRVGGNLYSVPETARRRVLEVQCLADEIRILEAGTVIARHVALEGRGQSVVDPAHRTARPAETRRAAQREDLAPRAGERVASRSLDFYDAVGRRLAVAGRA